MDKETLKFVLANEAEFDEIFTLYKEVIAKTKTTWDEEYPSKNIIIDDIYNSNLYILKDNNKIIAVSYLSKNTDEEQDWKYKLINPLYIARICVKPEYQGKGIGQFFLKKLIEKAKILNSDGIRFIVWTENIIAQKMYEKVGFENCGLAKSNYGFDFYKYELVF